MKSVIVNNTSINEGDAEGLQPEDPARCQRQRPITRHDWHRLVVLATLGKNTIQPHQILLINPPCIHSFRYVRGLRIAPTAADHE
jgi:hypothetical protein